MNEETMIAIPADPNDPEDGVIRLIAGDSGAGQLTVNSKLTADHIHLRAAGADEAALGSTASIVLGDAASFAGSAPSSGG